MDKKKIINAPDEEIVCYCARVSKGKIVKAIKEGHDTFSRLRAATGICPASSDCKNNNPKKRCCSSDVMELLEYFNGKSDDGNSGSCACCCGNKS